MGLPGQAHQFALELDRLVTANWEDRREAVAVPSQFLEVPEHRPGFLIYGDDEALWAVRMKLDTGHGAVYSLSMSRAPLIDAAAGLFCLHCRAKIILEANYALRR
ncbi:hypothetical protein DKM44_05900 [Deinococcus irradiatisoli]|uniref:Uncharacterized protein n=1 Tax=Deinococcus irradiatisoli TaxID=2202254 RepID=A0A2Z3JCZ7_9DEIO|nr:hypothetical protein DKM44_05900 [Deinococcus irradiatisoli]